MIARLQQGAVSYWQTARKLNRNIQVLLLATALGGIADGIFSVDFNLYILSLGIDAGALGSILSAGSLAHMLGSIPMGFLGEMFGYKTAFLAIYAIAGMTQLAQVATVRVPLILAAAFVGGLVMAGNFVVRLPFLAANAEESNRAHAFSLSLVTSGVSFSLGSLAAGHVPNLLFWISPDLATRYRFS
ncbi:MAG TPA: MFS transporter, partial [Anaerolineae bacterium]|nr:MFS transporter [Anaerolineae bacterium]